MSCSLARIEFASTSSGTYLISKSLMREVSFTRCVGEGKDATTILLDPNNWIGTVSPAAFLLKGPSYLGLRASPNGDPFVGMNLTGEPPLG